MGQPADHDGAVVALLVAQAVLALEVGGEPVQVGLDVIADLVDLIGVDPVEPFVGVRADFVGSISQNGFPLGRESGRVGLQIPVPDAVGADTRDEGVAFGAQAKGLPQTRVLDRVAEAPRQEERRYLCSDEHVGRAGIVGRVVVLIDQQHDRGIAATSDHVARGVDGAAPVEPGTNEARVVLGPLDRLDTLAAARHALHRRVGLRHLQEELLRSVAIAGVAANQQDPHTGFLICGALRAEAKRSTTSHRLNVRPYGSWMVHSTCRPAIPPADHPARPRSSTVSRWHLPWDHEEGPSRSRVPRSVQESRTEAVYRDSSRLSSAPAHLRRCSRVLDRHW